MYYLDYAKPVGNRYVLNFFADTIEDLKDVPTTTAYVTRNGTNYGIPLDTSVVTIVENGIRVNYVLQNGKYIVGGDIPPIVGTKTIIENGTYLAKDDDLEGYSSVTVEVPETVSEEKTVELDMASGDQTILPEEDKLLNKVVVKKPETLIAENIKDGINIGGVVGGLVTPTNKLPQVIERTITELTAKDLVGVTKIGDSAFYKCTNLQTVVLPNSVISIGDQAFYHCTNLDINLTDSVKTIGEYAFAYSGITKIYVPENIESVSNYACYNCSKLVRIDISDLKKYCEMSDLYWCKGYGSSPKLYLNNERLPKDLILPEQTTKICDFGFLNESIESIVFPNSVSLIGNSAFQKCEHLLQISIPDSVLKIDRNAFESCSNLEKIIIGNGTTEIGEHAFSSLGTKVKEIIIGVNVQNIRWGAFYYGETTSPSRKVVVTMLPMTPPVIGTNVFSVDYLNKIIVPKGTGDTYKAATNWSAFADYIEEATE